MKEHKTKIQLPSFIRYLFKLSTAVISVVGLMKMSSTKIEWTESADNIILYYKEKLSDPIKHFFEIIAIKFDFDIDWIPFWFYDYIPIASIFSFALLFSYLKSIDETIFNLIKDYFSTLYYSAKEEGIEGLGGFLISNLIAIIILTIFFFTSPLFIIAFPLLIASFFVAFIGFAVFIYFQIFRFLIIYILPLLIIGFLIFYLITYNVSKEKYITIITKHKNWLRKNYRIIRISIKIGIWRTKKYLRGTGLKNDIESSKKEIYWFFLLIRNQYISAFVIIIAFLIVLFINYNSKGFSLLETIDHVWDLLKNN